MAEEKLNLDLHLLEPRATEKSYLEQTNRIYVFPVKKSMGKQEIARLVEKEFNVTVTDVRTMIRKGKKTKFSKGKHAYPGITHRQDKNNSIRVFDEPEDNKTSAKEAKADKKAKKADKNAGKENK